MRLTFCVLCGEKDQSKLEHHHFIPKVLGGTDDETNMFTVCSRCHGVVHNIERPADLRKLMRRGHVIKRMAAKRDPRLFKILREEKETSHFEEMATRLQLQGCDNMSHGQITKNEIPCE